MLEQKPDRAHLGVWETLVYVSSDCRVSADSLGTIWLFSGLMKLSEPVGPRADALVPFAGQ